MGLAPVLAGQRITASMINGLPVTLSALTTGSVTNSTAETVIGTYAIPANDPVVGGGYLFRCFSLASDTGTPTLHFQIKLTGLGGTGLSDFTAVTCQSGASNMRIAQEFWMYFTATGSTGSFDCFGTQKDTLAGTAGEQILSGTPNVAVDTTAAIVLAITAKWSAASASNTATTRAGGLIRI